MKKTFKEKVQAMTGKEIVMAMVKGLQKEWVKVNMETFGSVSGNICYGCAATNAICEIEQRNYLENFPQHLVKNYTETRLYLVDKEDPQFVDYFEEAINYLRQSDFDMYNRFANKYGFAKLPEPKRELPYLTTGEYKENLQAYINYANTLD